ncbi:MAG: PLP-dependent aminotransferase family protein [Bacillota bacterium]|nr:PLP-dependent aminotransferase family protein [Bacillota bacterium]
MLTIPLQFDSKEPLYQQIYYYIRRAIETGAIEADEKLPSKRKLSAHLRVSVSTVETAYAQLKAEGYLYTKAKSGCHAAAVRLEKVRSRFHALPQSLREETETRPFLYDFRTDRVDPEAFPFSVWAKLTREVLSEGKTELLESVHPKGLYQLRVNIADHLLQFRGIEILPEQIIIGAGWEYLLTLIIQLLGRSRCYGVEDPGYQKVPKILRSLGCSVCYLPMDNEGISMDAAASSMAEVLHVTPSHHFPLGTVTSAVRRRDLLRWAEQGERYLIEDDYDSEFRYEGRPIPALLEMDHGGRVIYIKTFAKSLAPSLRIAYMVLPLPLLEQYEKQLLFYASTVSSIEQQVLSRFIGGGYLERHLNRSRNLYKKRRDIFIETMRKSSLSSRLEILGKDAGMHLLLRVKGMTEQELVAKAQQNSISLNGLSRYYHYPETAPQNTVIAGYAGWQEEHLRQGAAALAQALSEP